MNASNRGRAAVHFNRFAASNSRRGDLTAVLAMLLIATLIAYAPVLWNGYPANAWDSRYNAVTGRLFSEQFWSGDLYPRWLIGMNSGLGSPHFFFYAPLGYYIAAAFHWLSASTGLAQLGAAAVPEGFGNPHQLDHAACLKVVVKPSLAPVKHPSANGQHEK